MNFMAEISGSPPKWRKFLYLDQKWNYQHYRGKSDIPILGYPKSVHTD